MSQIARSSCRLGTLVLVRHFGDHYAVVLDAQAGGLVVWVCTSKQRPDDRTRMALHDWTELGLARPTFVKTHATVFIPWTDVHERVGCLNEADIDELGDLMRPWNRSPT